MFVFKSSKRLINYLIELKLVIFELFLVELVERVDAERAENLVAGEQQRIDNQRAFHLKVMNYYDLFFWFRTSFQVQVCVKFASYIFTIGVEEANVGALLFDVDYVLMCCFVDHTKAAIQRAHNVL